MEKARSAHRSTILIATILAVLMAISVIIFQVKRVADGLIKFDSDLISGIIIIVFISILPLLVVILVNLRVLNTKSESASIIGPVITAVLEFFLMLICFGTDFAIGFGRDGLPDDSMILSGVLSVLHLFTIYPIIATIVNCIRTNTNGYIYK